MLLCHSLSRGEVSFFDLQAFMVFANLVSHLPASGLSELSLISLQLLLSCVNLAGFLQKDLVPTHMRLIFLR
jgi:hypothetical protein